MILTLISVCNNLVSSGANKPWRLGFGNFLASWTDSSKTYDFGGKLGIRYIYHETISDFPQGFLEFLNIPLIIFEGLGYSPWCPSWSDGALVPVWSKGSPCPPNGCWLTSCQNCFCGMIPSFSINEKFTMSMLPIET